MRLNRYLAASRIASRRKSAELVQSGRVEVNGKPVTNPYRPVSDNDEVTLDGRRVSPPGGTVVLVLNKAKGDLTTVRDDRGRQTVLDRIDTSRRLFPVGRLDKDTTGVLLLTDDGDLAYRLTHPKFEVERIYRVTVDRALTARNLLDIEEGIPIGDGEIGQALVKGQAQGRTGGPQKPQVLLKLTHGKKREIRRMVSALGCKVIDLHRESFAGIGVNGLRPGEWRELTPEEVEGLRQDHPSSGSG